MAKIKGWRKQHTNNWVSEKGSVVRIVSAGRPFGIYTVYIHREGVKTTDKVFGYPKGAKDFAVDYMKKHPKG